MMDLKTFAELISRPAQVVITTHHKPDGDALGSSLAWYWLLKGLGHDVCVVVPTDFPPYFDWMPGRDKILNFGAERDAFAAAGLIAKAGFICCLDFNHLNRIGELGRLIALQVDVPLIMIDHHQDPQGFHDFAFWDTTASSTCELVYKLAVELGLLGLLDAAVATCLYTGIMTDTGSFRFPRTTGAVHRIVGDLLDRGADNVLIHDLVFDQQSENRLRFLGFCLKDKLVVDLDLHTAYFAIRAVDFESFGLDTGDTEGVVNYALEIAGVKLAALMIERTGKIKLSFRSKGSFPCNRLAAEHFSGGGHINAAGGESTLSLEGTLKKFHRVMAEYQQLLVI